MPSKRFAYLVGTFAVVAVLHGTPVAAHEVADIATAHFETEGRCTTCTGSPFFHWDNLYSDWRGTPMREASIYQGTFAAFQNCMQLRISGVAVAAASYTLNPDDRGITTAEYTSGSIRVTRETYFPESGLDFGRWVDSFRNAGAAEANVNVQYYCYYLGCTGGGSTYYYFAEGDDGFAEGGAGDDCTVGSADGDEITEAADLWYAWNDDDDSAKPAVALVTHGDGADEEPTDVNYAAWSGFTIDFRLTIPAGETQQLLLFLVQAEDTATAISTADYIVSLPPEATEGIELGGGALPDFENFITDGRPAVSPGGPYNIPEGGEIFLEPRMFDREGDPLTWAWDLDADGTFENNELNPLFSAADIDGPGEATVSIYVSEDIDGGHEVTRSTDIEILNVAPVILSEPPTGARRGGLYEYTPVVSDPAPADTFQFELVEDNFPVGMSLAEPALDTVTWTPRADQLGDHEVELFMEDDDGGEFTQSWTIQVTDNAPPYQPNPLYPIPPDCARVLQPTFKVSNSSDLDGDALFYYFEVDSDPGFRSIELQRSPDDGVPEGVSGFTEWQVPRPLMRGATYYWRTWVSDRIEESDKIVQVFDVCENAEGGDLDVDADSDADSDIDADADEPDAAAAGCACRTAGSPSGPASLLLGAAALVLFRRRRS